MVELVKQNFNENKKIYLEIEKQLRNKLVKLEDIIKYCENYGSWRILIKEIKR